MAVTVLIALAVLIGTQVWMTRRTHRLFNLPLVAATVCVVVLAGWALIAFSQSHAALATAQQQGIRPGRGAVPGAGVDPASRRRREPDPRRPWHRRRLSWPTSRT